MTRPVISDAARTVEKFYENPSKKNREAVVKILRYLQIFQNLGITYVGASAAAPI